MKNLLKKHNIGLKTKAVFILTLLLVSSMTGINISSYLQSIRVTEKKVIELEKIRLELIKNDIETVLNEHKKTLLSLSNVPPAQAILRANKNNGIDPFSKDSFDTWEKRLSTIFTGFLNNQPQYKKISYIDKKGNEIVSISNANIDNTAEINENFTSSNKTNYISESLKLKSGQVYISNVTSGKNEPGHNQSHSLSLKLATPIYTIEGEIEALMVINLSSNLLFNRVISEPGKTRNLIDHQGNYIKYNSDKKLISTKNGNNSAFKTNDPELEKKSRFLDDLIYHDSKKKEIIGFQKIYLNPEDKNRYWMISLNIKEDIIFSEISSAFNTILLISFFIGLVFLALILWFVSKNVVSPIINLASATKKLEKGDLKVRVDEMSVRDEFRTLYQAINTFADNQQNATELLEQEVKVKTKRLSSIINNVIDGIITIDKGGNVTSFNPAAERIFGYPESEIIGKNFNVLIPKSNKNQKEQNLEDYLKSDSETAFGQIKELTGLHKSGVTFPLELAVSEIDIEGDRHFVGITRDISERKQVEQLQREFISIVSHELRTPLTSISGSLGLILGGITGDLSDKAKSLIDIANNNCKRLIGLINDILDIEKIAAGNVQFEFKTLNIIPIIQQSIEDNRGYGEKYKVDFKLINQSDQDLMVMIDKKRIEQVMSNLLSNAAKYSPAQDQVNITVEQINDNVRISVHDNGKGIPEEFKPKIFGKFCQADDPETRNKGGSGLGLSITQAIIQSHKGDINFESEAGKGTTFYFYIPLIKENAPNLLAPAPPSDKPLILIVEDDRDASTLLGMMLTNAGYHFHQAYNYKEAMHYISRYQYDAVTLDLMIPGGSGIDLLREWRSNKATRKLPVIVVSAKVNEGKLEVAGEAFEMVDWVEKPIKEQNLIELINWRLQKESTKKGRILHVEDDQDITTIVRTLLENKYQMFSASSLEQAKQLINNEQFDLVLLDVNLPDGSGLSLLNMIQANNNPVPVVIFSAQDIPASIDSQVMATLVKPNADNEKLMLQIRSAINKKVA